MFAFPSWFLKTRPVGEWDRLLEYRLSMHDVAELLHSSVPTVRRWSRLAPGQQFLCLRSLKVGSHRAYRLGDVQTFARQMGMVVDMRNLPKPLADLWKIDRGVDMSYMSEVEYMNNDSRGDIT